MTEHLDVLSRKKFNVQKDTIMKLINFFEKTEYILIGRVLI